MGTKNNPGLYDCYDKAEPDEPMFVLLARDPKAPDLVRTWAYRSDPLGAGPKFDEAMACAEAMDAWRKAKRP
jgi:hypothetical protein